jgi:Na+-transporting NADH:ubiquinone oxidoreductase subunit NqrD
MKSLAHEKIIECFKTPLSSMSAAALLIIASVRVSYAIIMIGSLFWVFLLCTLLRNGIRKIIPDNLKSIINILLSSFVGSIFYLFLYFLNPFLAMECTLPILLVPVLYYASVSSDAFASKVGRSIAFGDSLRQATSLSILIFALALIREPLGFATLSVPGGSQGIIELFKLHGENSPLPIQIISLSAGALFLLAYILMLCQYFEAGNNKPEDLEMPEANDE